MNSATGRGRPSQTAQNVEDQLGWLALTLTPGLGPRRSLPNTLIKQGAKLVATGEDGWEEMPSNVRLELEAEVGVASKPGAQASLLPDSGSAPKRL
jgi:hypothetical protein